MEPHLRAGTVYAKTLRDSRLALIIVSGLVGAFLLSSGAAFGEAYNTPQSRQELVKPRQEPAARRWRACTATRSPSAIETLGGSIGWKTGASLGLMAALWSVLALSGTLASRGPPRQPRVRRHDAARQAPDRRSRSWRPTSRGWRSSSSSPPLRLRRRVRVRDPPGRRDPVDVGARVRPLGRGGRAGVGGRRVRPRPAHRARRLGGRSPARSSCSATSSTATRTASPAFARRSRT